MTYPKQKFKKKKKKKERKKENLGQRETYIFQANIIHEDLIQEKVNMNLLETRKNILSFFTGDENT